LKLKYDELLSNFGYNFNLSRYIPDTNYGGHTKDDSQVYRFDSLPAEFTRFAGSALLRSSGSNPLASTKSYASGQGLTRSTWAWATDTDSAAFTSTFRW
jgi:hypothetical protein